MAATIVVKARLEHVAHQDLQDSTYFFQRLGSMVRRYTDPGVRSIVTPELALS
jgi:hypothetical protein